MIAQLGYIPSIAYAYIPSEAMGPFAMALQNPTSGLYNNPNASVHDLFSFVNPAVPVQANATINFSSTTATMHLLQRLQCRLFPQLSHHQ